MSADPSATGSTARTPAATAAAATRQLDLATVGELLATLQALPTASSLEDGLAPVIELVDRLLPADTSAILLLDPLGRELSFAASRGIAAEVTAHWRFGMGQGIVGTVARSATPIRIDDVRQDGRYIALAPNFDAELAVPLVARGRAVGVLDLHRRGATFSAAEEDLASFLGQHLGVAIELGQLHQAGREQARTLSLLHDVGREVGSILDRRALLGEVGRRLQQLIGYDLFSVLLWDQDRSVLEPWLSLDRAGNTREMARAMRLGEGLCGTAAALRQPIRCPNVFLDPRYEGCGTPIEVRSELVVPLLYEDRLLGVLDLESSEYDAFREEHERLLVTLSATLAVALENARLYERVREEEHRLSSDLETARQIQLQLLPKASPWMPGLQLGVAHEPARQLGGDFYDYLLAGDNGQVGIAVADVAGKSTGAALYGSFAIGLLREQWLHRAAEGAVDPAALLADLNCSLHALGFGNRFVAMTLAVVDPGRRRLRLANGGLPHPLLLRAGSETADRAAASPVAVGGTPLGLLASRRYETVDLALEPGDVLVLATDGLEEALDADGHELGAPALLAALEEQALLPGAVPLDAGQLAQQLLARVRTHGGDREPSDDRTVVVLRAL